MKHDLDRDLRRALKAFLDRFELYECEIIERVSDSDTISEECRKSVEYADIILLILETDLRPGVEDEFIYARQLGKEILPFYRPHGATEKLSSFVRDVVRGSEGGTVPPFSTYEELIDLIEENLLRDLTRTYRQILNGKARDRRKPGAAVPTGISREKGIGWRPEANSGT